MIYKEEILPKKYIEFETLHSTEYDDLFDKQIKSRGLSYYSLGKVEKIIYKNNIYYADVIGAKLYKVKIKIENNSLNEISCTCPYHKDKNKYCKHIYATLMKIKMQNERKNIIEYINKYINNILSLVKEMNNTIEKNKNFLDSFDIKWYKKRGDSYKEIIKSYQKNYEELKDYELINLLKNLNFYLNRLYEDLNELNKIIGNTNKEYLKEKRKIKMKKIKKYLLIFGKIMLIVILLIFGIIGYIIDFIKSRRKNRLTFKQILLGLFLGFSLSNNKKSKTIKADYLMPWEQYEVDNGNYDLWNFEEEDLEEDDYYSDDLD